MQIFVVHFNYLFSQLFIFSTSVPPPFLNLFILSNSNQLSIKLMVFNS